MTFLKKLWKAIEDAQQKRADYHLLQMLSDRELRDLGIGRSQIRDIVFNDK
jgi:uncharacterized protein YjiS (DUF1127 family)